MIDTRVMYFNCVNRFWYIPFGLTSRSHTVMDIFGKTAKPKTSFQNELASKMKERKAAGLGADLTETENDDDDEASEDGK